MFRRLLVVITFALLAASCAKPPLLEMDAAQYMVKRAAEKQASEFAKSEYQAALTALEDARRAMDDMEYRAARESLGFALHHARRAVLLAEEGQIRRAAQEAQAAKRAREDAEEQRAREEAENVIYLEPPRQVQTPPPTPKPVPKQKPKIVPVNSYSVGDGETLWTISAQPQVYNEGLLWPLLYQANRDQIKDPRQIFPGQVLSIRRDMSAKDLDEARQRARESDIFPVGGAAPKQ